MSHLQPEKMIAKRCAAVQLIEVSNALLVAT